MLTSDKSILNINPTIVRTTHVLQIWYMIILLFFKKIQNPNHGRVIVKENIITKIVHAIIKATNGYLSPMNNFIINEKIIAAKNIPKTHKISCFLDSW